MGCSAWTIRVTEGASKPPRKLDKQAARRIMKEFNGVAQLEDPRSRGKALVGTLAGLRRYRVGDYCRIVCDIEDGALVVLVVDIVHSREIYRRRHVQTYFSCLCATHCFLSVLDRTSGPRRAVWQLVDWVIEVKFQKARPSGCRPCR